MNSIIQWNINGLFKHLNDVKRLKYSIQPIVFCFQETNLKAHQDFPLRGYNGYYKNRQNTAYASGGMATYISNLIQGEEIQIRSPLEAIAVIINIKNPICI